MLHAPASSAVAALTRALPTSHVPHESAPSPEYWPTPQSSQALASGPTAPVVTFPGEHGVQAVADATLKVPLSHESHALLSVAVAAFTKNFALAHAEQDSVPGPL